MKAIFVDESGSFSSSVNDRYFIIASFTVENPKKSAKAFRVWQQQRFPKGKRFQAENKFSDRGISDDLRRKTLRYIASLGVGIHFGFCAYKDIPKEYVRNGKIQQAQLYTSLLGRILSEHFPLSDSVCSIFCDQRALRGMKKSEFYLELISLLSRASPETMINIHQIDSTTDPNIQIADWIVGALAAFIYNKPLGQEYHQILRGNILGDPVRVFSPRKQKSPS